MTEKEHYVPQFYLRSFTNSEGKIETYDSAQKRFFSAYPKDLCFEKNTYETPFEEANEKLGGFVTRNDIEKIYSMYEYRFSKLLKVISQRCVPAQNKNALILSSEEKDTLCKFVVNLLVRNPISMEQLRVDQLDDDFMTSDFFISLRDTLDEMNLGGAKSVCIAAQKKAMITAEFEESIPDYSAKKLREINFTFYYSKDGGFITSDNPVCYGTDRHLSDEDACLYLAITPNVAVIFGNYKNSKLYRNRMVSIEQKIVELLNQEIVKKRHFSRFVFANNKDILRRYYSEE